MSNQEHLLCVEMIGDQTIGVSFLGFFNEEIKDKIKRIQGAEYDYPNKIWKLPFGKRDEMIDAVGAICVENGVKVFDVPEFVKNFSRTPVPFTG